jgi:hypothetical protein
MWGFYLENEPEIIILTDLNEIQISKINFVS